MRIHYLQHVAFEGPGHIDHWARDHGHSGATTSLFAGDLLPHMDTFDVLVVLGGPMGVHDTSEFDWLSREKHFIERSLVEGKRVLGICLGAQLIGDVLGAQVYKNRDREIGWHRVNTAADTSGTLWADVLPDEFIAFHWHGDTFDLPAGAIHLAKNEACQHQAFFYPPATLGLQFHLESTLQSIELLMDHCGGELIPAAYVQSRAEIQEQAHRISPSNKLMRAILDCFQKIR